MCQQYDVTEVLEVSILIDECDEDGDLFYKCFTENGGSLVFAEKLRYLMKLGHTGRLTFEVLRNTVSHPMALEAIDNLNVLYNEFSKTCGKDSIILVPYMPKSWDAYTTIIYDARVSGYDKAIAGGGNLLIDPANSNCIHSGAGIGVTRIAESLIACGESDKTIETTS